VFAIFVLLFIGFAFFLPGFMTGDAFSVDAQGNYYFVDRIKGAIRRRGENVSSFEVENEVDAHPAVLESAAIAVASEFAEDEIKVVVSLKPDATLTAQALLEFLRPRLPLYMLPRYIEITWQGFPRRRPGKFARWRYANWESDGRGIERKTSDRDDRFAAG